MILGGEGLAPGKKPNQVLVLEMESAVLLVGGGYVNGFGQQVYTLLY